MGSPDAQAAGTTPGSVGVGHRHALVVAAAVAVRVVAAVGARRTAASPRRPGRCPAPRRRSARCPAAPPAPARCGARRSRWPVRRPAARRTGCPAPGPRGRVDPQHLAGERCRGPAGWCRRRCRPCRSAGRPSGSNRSRQPPCRPEASLAGMPPTSGSATRVAAPQAAVDGPGDHLDRRAAVLLDALAACRAAGCRSKAGSRTRPMRPVSPCAYRSPRSASTATTSPSGRTAVSPPERSSNSSVPSGAWATSQGWSSPSSDDRDRQGRAPPPAGRRRGRTRGRRRRMRCRRLSSAVDRTAAHRGARVGRRGGTPPASRLSWCG